MSTRILIIGSGAVGAAFGHHLVQAGCQVNYLVRSRKSSNSVMPRELHRYRFPSDALDSDWLKKQLSVFDSDTPLISWTPDFGDHARLAAIYPGPVQHGLIGLISFHTPLPGTSQPGDGFGYLLPPRSAVLDNSRAGQQAAALLRAGGMPSASIDHLDWFGARATALNINAIAALEICDWSLREVRRSVHLQTACAAAREAIIISAAYLNRDAGLAAQLPRPLLLKTLTALAPKVMPFPLETYLKYHFSKVGEQTRMMLDNWIREGTSRSLPVGALSELRQQLTDGPKAGA
ncbi:MAG: hypothetical protein CVV10_03645 [Gammaproteobacteria bacterium HGW-Gammaproteobacteria-14]|nr:MAG: hypothetical protein CVV10_03645 [Gammaproteobacteria bacterium HGW-Gammaproteobacteria-14]